MQQNVDESKPALIIRTDEFNENASATERAEFVAELVRMVEEMIPERAIGAEGFDASKWVAQWLDQSQPALAGNSPASYLDTANGRTMVRRLLGLIESGAYA